MCSDKGWELRNTPLKGRHWIQVRVTEGTLKIVRGLTVHLDSVYLASGPVISCWEKERGLDSGNLSSWRNFSFKNLSDLASMYF